MKKSKEEKKHSRIYVCHTFYHVYVTFLKELNIDREKNGRASLVLSSLSTDFKDLRQRIQKIDFFEEVFEFDEKRETYFPKVEKFKINRKNLFINMIQRIIYTSKFSIAQEAYVPTDFSQYKDVFVFCDCDPIGIYLAKHRIYFHAIEDGLNSAAGFTRAKFNDPSAWNIKKFMSLYLNLIYLCEGYNKYCLDMEVNDLSLLKEDFYKNIEVSRDKLLKGLSENDKEILLKVFVPNSEKMGEIIGCLRPGEKSILILTEDLCDLETRRRIFTDLINMYSPEGAVFIKPHPRDVFDYKKEFPEVLSFEASFPMEILNLFPSLHFSKVVSIFTPLLDAKFADEKVFLGKEFMDKYEDPSLHYYHKSAKMTK